MFGRKKVPCVPDEVRNELLKEVYSEVLAEMGYTWGDFSARSTVRMEVGTKVNAHLFRGDLDEKIKARGYRICVGK